MGVSAQRPQDGVNPGVDSQTNGWTNGAKVSRCFVVNMAYEGTFLMAVATAYFLALNGLAAYLFILLIRTREEVREVQGALRRTAPRVEEMAHLAGLMVEAGSEKLKKKARTMNKGGGQ